VVETTADLDVDWSTLRTPSGLYASREWLEVCERVAAGPVRFVVARARSGRAAGLLPVFVLPPSSAGIYAPQATLTPELARDMGSRGVLLAGAAGGYRTGFALADGAGAPDAVILASLLMAADGLATDLEADCFTAQYLPRSQAELLVRTQTVGPDELVFQTCEVLVELAGRSFDDHVAALSARRRSTVRRDLAAFSRAGLHVEELRLSDALGFAPQLFVQLKEHHRSGLDETEARDYLEVQARSLDHLSVVFAARAQAGETAAYAVAFRWGDMLFVRLVGLDYGLAEPAAAYFQVAYYEPLRYAYEHGLSAVHFGIKSLRPKVLRGGRLEELYGVFRGRGGERLPPRVVAEASSRNAAAVADELGPLLDSPPRGFRGEALL
jgi:uncharacterized protein